MSLATLKNKLGAVQFAQAISQLQSRAPVRATGAAANTKINVPNLVLGDTIVYCEYHPTAAGDPVAITDAVIQDTRASGTVTFATAVDGNTFAINGVTFRMKTVPIATDGTDILLSGTDAQNATRAAAAVNAYFSKKMGANYNKKNVNTVTASSTGSTGVVTFTASEPGVGNAPVITGTVTVLAASGSATASATLTCATVVNGNTFVVHGVTFTLKTTPVAKVLTDVALAAAADNTLQAAIIAKAINAYQNAVGFAHRTQATAALAVVTITPMDAKKGNIIPLAGTVTTLAASGTTLANGTATGGIKTATNTASGTVLVDFLSTH